MNKYLSSLLSSSIICSLVGSCAPYHFTDHRAAVCNELNSKLIFSGGTSNTREAEIQNAEDPLTQRTYDRSGCDRH